MHTRLRTRWAISCLSLLVGMTTTIESAIAQVTADSSLSTQVSTSDNLNFTIEDGATKETNLFHSFTQFSIPENGSAVFNNPAAIENIFARVTGSTASIIDGTIKTINPTNLFLINPSGIVFDSHASLDIGGAFVATTADSLIFSDGIQFSATQPSNDSLLTISVPTGLQMSAIAGDIRVEGAILQGQPESVIAFVSNGIQLNGGTLAVESGQLELGSTQGGVVGLNTNPDPNAATEPWQFDYGSISALSDIYLTDNARIDASGSPGGSIQIHGQVLQIEDGSTVLIQHRGTEDTAGKIQINADTLNLIATLPTLDAGTVLSENLGQGTGANIAVSARQITGQNGGSINATTLQNGGRGGSITVNAAESIRMFGYAPSSATSTSGINTPANQGGGRGGDIFVTSPEILLQDGAGIGSLVFGGNGGGGLYLYSDRMSILGENAGTGGASFVAATTFFGGDAGVIDIKTGQLRLEGGGLISASTSELGNAGSLTIQAYDFIEVNGAGSVVSQPSRITASGQAPPGRFQQIFGLPSSPSGDAGDLSITSPTVRVLNQGYIAVENVGGGNAGQLVINADSILLDRQGQIQAATAVGEGGNLILNAQDVLLLRHNSLISAKAGGLGNGGNIAINAPVVIGLENSDLVANAVQGAGGNIQINTQSILGLQFRDQLTPDNDITASSQFGVSGTVEINNFSVDPASGLVELPDTISDSSEQIAQGCHTGDRNAFVATGRGGLSVNPTDRLVGNRPWADVRAFSGSSSDFSLPSAALTAQPDSLVEANRWEFNDDGQVELAFADTRQQPLATPFVNCSDFGVVQAQGTRSML